MGLMYSLWELMYSLWKKKFFKKPNGGYPDRDIRGFLYYVETDSCEWCKLLANG